MLAYLDCVGGLAGDMLLAALVDAGAPEEVLRRLPDQLGIAGVELRLAPVERHSIRALKLDVTTVEPLRERDWRSIRTQLENADLPEHIRADAVHVFARLAHVEASIHAVPVEEVHFHELGAIDTLIDIVGAVALLDALGVKQLACSPLPLGRGTIATAHGMLPAPAPATTALLIGAPVVGVNVEGELVTPTGAALASTLASTWGPQPAMTLTAIGYGAGTHDWTQRANVVRIMLGHATSSIPTREVVVLEANVDDLLPELVPDAVAACFAAGALDVWTTPAAMKKGRPGLVFSALARPEQQEEIARAMMRETSTLGVRIRAQTRYELERKQHTVDVRGLPVRVKIGQLGDEVVNVSPEHEDCATVARETGTSVKSIWAAALAAAVRDG